ncbi:hypothetical protein HXP45_20435 [Streptomyces actuosus]|uniref:Uncharacterized protein n=1 Tax=Streptomyces actuosus TaxID=1885 RepID=A0A2U9PF95_STRAS|nr:hypothetical protein DMT42_33405 [Streptomyces actuosus]MBM4823436.1 hypothetical protein [Streptomyces actuosus]
MPKTDFSRKVTLVVYGDLASKVVTDDRRTYSSTLVDAEAERSQGRHICVVDADGFSNLLKERPAPCLELRSAGAGRVRPVAAATTESRILGRVLRMRRTGRRLPGDLTLDLSRLDKATAAHEATIGALIAHLSRQDIEVHTYAPGAPAFDAGWSRGDEVFVAEIKSLTGAREDQQIRLGIGQILDYTHQLRTAFPSTLIRPILVLEKPPTDARWTSLAGSVGLRLTWAPGFSGI